PPNPGPFGLVLGAERDPEADFGAAFRAVGGGDLAVVEFDDRLYEGEANPGAARVATGEAAEHVGQERGSEAWPVVGDDDLRGAARRLDGNGDLASTYDGVADEVVDGLAEQ